MIANIDTGRILAISDIHGCYETFMALIEQLRLQKNDNLFITGDIINRGKDTKKLIKTLIALRENGYHIFPICGNHEYYLISTLLSPDFDRTIQFEKTLNAWILKKDGTVKPKYRAFFTELPYFYSVENVYFVHGGFNFLLANPFEAVHSMLHYRGRYDENLLPPEMRIVHGHTPVSLEIIKQKVALNSKIINIDSGCVYKNIPELGNLVCLDVRAMELFVQKNVE
ncbi:MAG: metallophosphoesterase [Bacteroidetes bacterium]|nr:metallophosphoesterase [Bacteroidota bacterium]